MPRESWKEALRELPSSLAAAIQTSTFPWPRSRSRRGFSKRWEGASRRGSIRALDMPSTGTKCQGRNEMPQDRRSKVPQKRRFENSPASVVLLHRGRRGKMTEHAGFQFLFQAIALTANIDGDGMVQQAIQDGRRDHMVVKNVAPGAVALVAG